MGGGSMARMTHMIAAATSEAVLLLFMCHTLPPPTEWPHVHRCSFLASVAAVAFVAFGAVISLQCMCFNFNKNTIYN